MSKEEICLSFKVVWLTGKQQTTKVLGDWIWETRMIKYNSIAFFQAESFYFQKANVSSDDSYFSYKYFTLI